MTMPQILCFFIRTQRTRSRLASSFVVFVFLYCASSISLHRGLLTYEDESVDYPHHQQEQESIRIAEGPSFGRLRSSTTNNAKLSTSQVENRVNRKRLYVPDKENTLLSVPFYVYPELLEIVDKAMYKNMSVHDVVASPTGAFGGLHKHDDDYHFIQSARYHPMRTLDPAKAKLFVVPVLFNLATLGFQYQNHPGIDNNDDTTGELCYESKPLKGDSEQMTVSQRHCNDKLVQYIDQFLSQSTYFQKQNGADHMVTLPFFHWDAYQQEYLQNLKMCNAITFGDDPIPLAEGRLNLPTMYVGNPCHDYDDIGNINGHGHPTKIYDIALIATLRSGPKYRFRRRICEWLTIMNNESNNRSTQLHHDDQYQNVSMEFCGSGRQCPTLAEAKFGFHVRGDSHSSSRLYDTLLSSTVPIFTTAKQYLAVPDFIDWDQLSYFVDMLTIDTNEKLFRHNISSILDDEEGYNRRYNAVRQNRALFDWTTGTPFDMYMYRLQVHLWPELALKGSNFSVLKLA